MKTTACLHWISRGRRWRSSAAATPWATAATFVMRSTSWRASSRRGTRRRASGPGDARTSILGRVASTARGVTRISRRYMPAVATATRTRKLLGEKFCGCPLDQVNEGDKTEARLSEWLDILAGEGFFGGDATAAPAPAPAAAAGTRAAAGPAPAPAAAAVGAAPEPAVVDAVRGLLPDVGADPAKPYILTNENLVQLLMAQHSRLQRALRRSRSSRAACWWCPPPRPSRPADDGEPPAKLDGGALATVRSVEVIVPDTPEGSAPIAHVELATSLPFVEGQCVSVLPPGNDEKGNPHKKRRLYTVASERGAQLALCVREVGVTSNFLHTIPKGSQLHLEGPMGKSMVLPSDPKAGLVLIGTSTGAATFRGFLRRLYPANAAPTAGRGPIVVILGGATREAIPYVEEFEQAQERLGPGRFRLELALGGARVDDGSETTLPDKIKGLSLIAKEIMDRGGHTYVSGLRGMLEAVRGGARRVHRHEGAQEGGPLPRGSSSTAFLHNTRLNGDVITAIAATAATATA